MSILFDDQDEPLLNLNDMDDKDDEPFRSCAPSAAFSATASTRSLGTPSSLLSQPSGLPIQSIARLTHDELTHNPEFVKYVDMVSHLQELLNLRRNPSTTTNSTTVSSATTSSLRPSESASQISSGAASLRLPLLPHRPLARPDCYPESVVWTTKDCKTDPDVGGSASNSSRPPMHHAVRHENGKMISDPEWQSIRQAAFTVARSHLDPLRCDPRAIPEKMHKKTFMKGAFLNEWLDAVTALERFKTFTTPSRLDTDAAPQRLGVLTLRHRPRAAPWGFDTDTASLRHDSDAAPQQHGVLTLRRRPRAAPWCFDTDAAP
ncbi:hypothetical protein EDB85DRAFT_2150417 [Lactarius pseudohatsudake]|nr:hypothetical protein EDB85DRAFT_2150417 [Lactarius pseudohatsudake]